MSKKVTESITEGHDPNYNSEVYKEMIKIIIKHYELAENYNSDKLYQELAEYYKGHPDAVEDDIMHLTWNDIISKGDWFTFATYVGNSAQPGMSQQDCIKLAQRYHFMLLTRLQKEWDNPSYNQKQETFRLYEEMCDNIIKGYATAEEVAFLKKLPEIENWDHDKAYEMTYGSPFFPGKPKFIDFDDVKQMERRYIDLHPEKSQSKAREILNITEKIKRLEDPENHEENFRIWLGEELRKMQIDKVTDEE